MNIKQSIRELFPRFSLIRDFQKQPYLLRLTLINFFDIASIKIHIFLKSDEGRSQDGRAYLHSHPWRRFFTIILYGKYFEVTEKGRFLRNWLYMGGGDGNYFHRVELDKWPADHKEYPNEEKICVTLFTTFGKHGKEWGFKCSDRNIVNFKTFRERGGCE